MSSPVPPPLLPYAGDAANAATVQFVDVLYRCLCLATFAFFLFWVGSFFPSANDGATFPVVYYGIELVVMTLVALLAWKLNNLLTAVVLAVLIIVPCAGLFIPLAVLMHAREFLEKAHPPANAPPAAPLPPSDAASQ